MVGSPRGHQESAMDDRTKARLDALLHDYAGEQDSREGEAAQEVASARRARRRFVALREAVIEPAMREVGEYLRARGHDYEVRSSETRDVGAGRHDEPSIALVVYPRGYSRAKLDPAHTPMVTFRAGDAPGRLRTHLVKRVPGRSGAPDAGRAYELDDVTAEVVRHEILELLEAVLGRPSR
jgi:hypothetical protein